MLGYGILEAPADVSPGEEEMDFQIDFISSVWSLILRVVRQENIKLFTYVYCIFF